MTETIFLKEKIYDPGKNTSKEIFIKQRMVENAVLSNYDRATWKYFLCSACLPEAWSCFLKLSVF